MCGVCVWVLVQPTKARRRRAPGRTTAARTTAGATVDAWASSEDGEGLDSGAWEVPLRDRPKTVHGKGKRGAVRGAFRAAPCACRASVTASLHQYYRTPQRAPVQAALRPPSRGRRAGGDATTTAPPLPDRRATRGVSSRCDLQRARGYLHTSPPGEARNGDCSHLHSPKRCERHSPGPSQ